MPPFIEPLKIARNKAGVCSAGATVKFPRYRTQADEGAARRPKWLSASGVMVDPAVPVVVVLATRNVDARRDC
jgi:hypothetical protein